MNWQPIETAPKDGGGLIYFRKSNHIEDATFNVDKDGDWCYMLYDGSVIMDPPTHWMPLPEPPEQY